MKSFETGCCFSHLVCFFVNPLGVTRVWFYFVIVLLLDWVKCSINNWLVCLHLGVRSHVVWWMRLPFIQVYFSSNIYFKFDTRHPFKAISWPTWIFCGGSLFSGYGGLFWGDRVCNVWCDVWYYVYGICSSDQYLAGGRLCYAVVLRWWLWSSFGSSLMLIFWRQGSSWGYRFVKLLCLHVMCFVAFSNRFLFDGVALTIMIIVLVVGLGFSFVPESKLLWMRGWSFVGIVQLWIWDNFGLSDALEQQVRRFLFLGYMSFNGFSALFLRYDFGWQVVPMVSSVAEFAVKGLSSEAGSNFDGLSWFVSGFSCMIIWWSRQSVVLWSVSWLDEINFCMETIWPVLMVRFTGGIMFGYSLYGVVSRKGFLTYEDYKLELSRSRN